MSLPLSPFPSYRNEVSWYLRELLADPHSKIHRQIVGILFKGFNANGIASILLPANGLFLAPHVSMLVKPANMTLPFEAFFLEYSITANEGWCQTAHGPLSAAVLGVVVMPATGIHLWKLTLGPTKAGAAATWSIADVGIRLDRKCLIAVTQGQVSVENAAVIVPDYLQLSQTEQYSRIEGYLHEMHVLAHFLAITENKNVGLKAVAAPSSLPGKYHVLGTSGPTPFDWLPGTGMDAH
jgi:hypothetical protein